MSFFKILKGGFNFFCPCVEKIHMFLHLIKKVLGLCFDCIKGLENTLHSFFKLVNFLLLIFLSSLKFKLLTKDVFV